MAPTLGNFALWLSLFFAVFQFFTSRKNNKLKFIAIGVNGLLFSSLISFFLLMYVHIVSDFRFQSELIKELPKVETSSNFIINLNNRIDKYHSNNKYYWSKVFETNRIKYIPLFTFKKCHIIYDYE